MIRQAAIIRRTAMSYDRLMELVADQAMQRAMVQINRKSMAPAAPAVLQEPQPQRGLQSNPRDLSARIR
jgi:hypothetical protein